MGWFINDIGYLAYAYTDVNRNGTKCITFPPKFYMDPAGNTIIYPKINEKIKGETNEWMNASHSYLCRINKKHIKTPPMKKSLRTVGKRNGRAEEYCSKP